MMLLLLSLALAFGLSSEETGDVQFLSQSLSGLAIC